MCVSHDRQVEYGIGMKRTFCILGKTLAHGLVFSSFYLLRLVLEGPYSKAYLFFDDAI